MSSIARQPQDNPLSIFDSERFGQVRATVDQQGEPVVIGRDVCSALDIKNSKDALGRLRDKHKTEVGIADPTGRIQSTTAIYEPGIYSLIFRSNKPEAREFEDWVTEKVLPSLRKTGSYSVEQQSASNLDIAERMLNELRQAEREREQLRAEQQHQSERLESAEAELGRFSDGHGQWTTVIGWANRKNHEVATDKIGRKIGRRARQLTLEAGLAPSKIPDGRYGHINAYPPFALEQAFAEELDRRT